MSESKSSAIWVTANEQFKARSENWMSAGVMVAVAAHVALFSFFPTLSIEDFGSSGDVIDVVPPIEVELPPPPEEIARPAMPRVSDVPIDDGITIETPPWDRVPELGPPMADAGVADAPVWVARDREPRLMNRVELGRMAMARYPAMLREAGVTGTVRVYFYVSESGEVTNAVVQTSSGYPQFDRVAVEVARTGHFEPAMNRDKPVGVWILLPIEFSLK